MHETVRSGQSEQLQQRTGAPQGPAGGGRVSERAVPCTPEHNPRSQPEPQAGAGLRCPCSPAPPATRACVSCVRVCRACTVCAPCVHVVRVQSVHLVYVSCVRRAPHVCVFSAQAFGPEGSCEEPHPPRDVILVTRSGRQAAGAIPGARGLGEVPGALARGWM